MTFRSMIPWTAALAVLVNLLPLPAAWAISVGNGAGPSVETSYDYFLSINNGWFIPDPTLETSVPVSLDPTAGPWRKTLNMPVDGITEGTLALVFEALTVDGDTPWTDWHEEIRTPGWEWIELDTEDITLPGIFEGSAAVSGLSFILSPTNVDFFFDPIQPGTSITIAKVIQFVGTDSTNPDEIAVDPILLAEYPTASAIPEPATVVLMGLGLVGLGYAGRRKLVG